MMRNAGFSPHIAAGITAAAASGGALVPPVMGAGAYMMLELVQPQVTFLDIAKAALIPAVLYYLSIFLIVHFYSRKVDVVAVGEKKAPKRISKFEALVFFGALGSLVLLLLLRFSPFKAVTGSLMVILVLSALRKELPISAIPRALAVGSFFVATLLYYFLVVELQPDASGRQIFEAWLAAGIVGMFALLTFGIAHPAWR